MSERTPATHVYLVRHGESEWNKEGRFCGSSDCALTAHGRYQAGALAAWLRHLPIGAVYASPLVRALDTARPLATALGFPLRARRSLRERDYGAWEGLRFDEILAAWPEHVARFKEDPSCVAPPGGEDCASVGRRFRRALGALVRAHRGESIAVVAHQSAIRIFLAPLLGVDLRDHYRAPQLALGNSAASLLRYDADSRAPAIVWVNRTTHLGAC